MRTGHLFAGIDGFGLGLEAVGPFATTFVVEWADFPMSVLRHRLPDSVLFHSDVSDFDPPEVDVITGGFPCQDLSLAGLGAGIGGSRSGLWTEYARIIAAAKPAVVLIENVTALLSRGMELVVDNLVTMGYRVEWDCLPAAAFGAPHLRDRVWVIARRIGPAAPAVFGDPATLFPYPWRDLPAQSNGWRKWPRAGYVDGDGVTDLVPIAPVSAVRGGAILPTPTVHEGPNSGGNDLGRVPTPVARDWKGAGRQGQLGTVAASGLWPTPASMDATSGHTGRADTKGRHSLALHHLANNGVLEDADDADDAVDRLDAIRWPTPKASPSGPDFARSGRDGSGAGDLATRVARLSTPTASDALYGTGSTTRKGSLSADVNTGLTESERAKARALLPTPAASDGSGGRIERQAITNAAAGGDFVRDAGSRPQKTLASAVELERLTVPIKHHPGPRTEGRETERQPGALNPAWVEWLMGFPLGWTDTTVANDDLVPWPWEAGEPDGIPRTAANVPERKGRLTALGNALVPQAPAWLAARILPLLEAEGIR